MSGFYFLPVVLTIAVLALLDGTRAALWLAGLCIVLNTVLLLSEVNLKRSAGNGGVTPTTDREKPHAAGSWQRNAVPFQSLCGGRS